MYLFTASAHLGSDMVGVLNLFVAAIDAVQCAGLGDVSLQWNKSGEDLEWRAMRQTELLVSSLQKMVRQF